MISQDYLQELIHRSDIVEVASNHIQLRHRGRTYTGICPFHNEKTPSFHIYPDTQSFYCFGCGAGGDVISFVKRIHQLDYVEAVKLLASRTGMPLPDEEDKAGKARARLLQINKEAARFYFDCLNGQAGSVARHYWVAKRGLSPATIKRFGLGFAPDSFSAVLTHLKQKGYQEDELLVSGLVKQSKNGRLYDVFRNRVMIPIFDIRGNVIAFGGRNLGEEKPKYINSPETQVYKKSRTMFAMNIAKKSKSRRYLLCEGYLDVLSLHQAGFDTAVAGCGTALTAEQVKLLSEYADEIVLCYDADEAGQKAAQRAMELFSQTQVKLSVLQLPNAKDPDEFLKNQGPQRFQMLLERTHNVLEHELMQIQKKYDLHTDDGRIQYLKEGTKLLATNISAIEREVYAARLEAQTNVSKENILSQVQQHLRTQAYQKKKQENKRLMQDGIAADIHIPYGKDGAKQAGVQFAQQQLLAGVLKNPDYLPLAASYVSPKDFQDEDLATVYEHLLEQKRQGKNVELAGLSAFVSSQVMAKLAKLLARNDAVPLSEQDIERFAKRMIQDTQPENFLQSKTPQELAEYLQQLKQQKL